MKVKIWNKFKTLFHITTFISIISYSKHKHSKLFSMLYGSSNKLYFYSIFKYTYSTYECLIERETRWNKRRCVAASIFTADSLKTSLLRSITAFPFLVH